MTSRVIQFAVGISCLCMAAQSLAANEATSHGFKPGFHLTARPWLPSDSPKSDYLDTLEGICRFTAQHQDPSGAVIDPLLGREHQYSTPYFAYALGVLLRAGRADDLAPGGINAMEHATRCFAGGWREIPDAHGEFFLAPLARAFEFYSERVDEATRKRWRERLETPLQDVMRDFDGRTNNWRTYAMKGEWLRADASLVARQPAIDFIEDAWLRRTQRTRIAGDRWNLYQDWSSDPQSHAVEAVGRANLLALVEKGYPGPSRIEIEKLVRRGTRSSLMLQSLDGQCPPNGRTDNHVFNDVLYQLAFEVMARRALAAGDLRQAGQFRRAAQLAFESISRWRRADGPWSGSFYVTKNRLDPALRVGYQPASNYTNYNGAVMYHLAEAYRARSAEIEPRPSPAEIGGYVIETDPRFASLAAAAGGIQLFVNLRGDTVPKYGMFWTPLGVVRVGRTGWDGRIGPADGARDARTGQAASLAPTWFERGCWVRLAERARDYRGTATVGFVHPLLVRLEVLWHTVTGSGGPTFRQQIVITPDGVLTTVTCSDDRPFGLTLPVLVDDGQPLRVHTSSHIVSTSFAEEGDQQNFLIVQGEVEREDDTRVLSTYGWLRPTRAAASDGAVRVFIYPRASGEPAAREVLDSFRITTRGFRSALSRVEGNTYSGTTSAGGQARAIDHDSDGMDDVQFDAVCNFMLRLEGSDAIAIEADREVSARIGDREIRLEAFTPIELKGQFDSRCPAVRENPNGS